MPRGKTLLRKTLPVLFWLLVWHVAARVMNQPILLVSPLDALSRLKDLLLEADFWLSIAFSTGRILLGLGLAAFLGIGLACAANKLPVLRELLAPLNSTVKTVPVASFVILVLLWTESRNLSIVISLLIAFPVIYSNTLSGLDHRDRALSEMAQVFRLPFLRRVLYVNLPQVLPSLRTGLSLACGMAFKSGIAAEVIGIPAGSLGERLYEAKIYLDTADLLAWTLVIVLVSALCDRLLSLLLTVLERRCLHCS